MTGARRCPCGLLVMLLVVGLCALQPVYADEGNISTTDKYAWSERAGWLNFRPSHSGVTVYADHLEGYAWAENIGWIKLGSHSGGGAYTYNNSGVNDWGVNYDANGALSGYAWSETAGWINFNPTHSQVTINNVSGEFSGYAWSENLGWVHFSNADPAYGVVFSPEMKVNVGIFPDGPDVPNNSAYTVASEMSPGSTKILQFRITNTGTQDLSLRIPMQIGGSSPDVIDVIEQPGSSIARGETTDMVLMFISQSNGPQDATVTIPYYVGSTEVLYTFTLIANPGEARSYILWTY